MNRIGEVINIKSVEKDGLRLEDGSIRRATSKVKKFASMSSFYKYMRILEVSKDGKIELLYPSGENFR